MTKKKYSKRKNSLPNTGRIHPRDLPHAPLPRPPRLLRSSQRQHPPSSSFFASSSGGHRAPLRSLGCSCRRPLGLLRAARARASPAHGRRRRLRRRPLHGREVLFVLSFPRRVLRPRSGLRPRRRRGGRGSGLRAALGARVVPRRRRRLARVFASAPGLVGRRRLPRNLRARGRRALLGGVGGAWEGRGRDRKGFLCFGSCCCFCCCSRLLCRSSRSSRSSSSSSSHGKHRRPRLRLQAGPGRLPLPLGGALRGPVARGPEVGARRLRVPQGRQVRGGVARRRPRRDRRQSPVEEKINFSLFCFRSKSRILARGLL